MKAIVYTKYGAPSVLRAKNVTKPVPEDREVLVKVMATTVNRTDCANLSAKPFIMRLSLGLLKPNNPIPGTEFAGEIIEVGEGVTSFKVGDRVFGFDDGILSSYAEYLTIKEDKGIATIPEGISFLQAAASTEGAHYAYNFINKVDIKPGQKILVNGASGGIGSAAVQFLKSFNHDVIAVCNTKNIELAKRLGASRVIDYTKEDFTKDNQKYDYVLDTVGKSSYGKCKRLLNPGGVYISSELGWMVQNLFFALITAIFGSLPGQQGKKVIFPYPANIRRSVLLIKKFMEQGKFTAVIDRAYPLEEISDAFKYVEKGQKTGNVVITLENQS